MLIFWTDDKIQELKTLWTKGDSAAVIGKTIGATRNAVLGKAHRLDLSDRSAINGYRYGGGPPRDISVRIGKSVFKTRERKPALNVVRLPSKPSVQVFTSVITGHFLARKRAPVQRELTKPELRAMLAQAMANTAAMS